MAVRCTFLLCVTLACSILSTVHSQVISKTPLDQIENFFGTCTSKYRKFDGRCNAKLGWGAADRVQAIWPPSNKREDERPSARLVSNEVLHQEKSIPNARGMSEIVTFFGQFVDHNFAGTPTLEERMDIPIPDDDPWFGNITGSSATKLIFHKSQKKRRSPTNILSSWMDGSAIYGNSEERAKALRSNKDGLMKVSSSTHGDLLPKNTGGVENAPTSNSAKFFIAGDDRSNEHPVLTCLHTIFIREHNSIAKEVKEKNKGLDDEEIYQIARKINVGQFQKIVYKEFLPAMLGNGALPPYTGRKDFLNPDVTTLLTTATFRVGHTMVNEQITRKGAGNSNMPGVQLKNAFFNPGIVEADGIEVFLRGAAKTAAQEIDAKITMGLRNFLFTKVVKNFPEVPGFDLASLNIQRGRDHKIGDYYGSLRRFRIRDVKDFSDITSDTKTANALKKVYKDIKNVDAWVAGLAEDHVSGSSLGRLFHKSWVRDFTRIRDADTYYFENKGEFSAKEKEMYDRVKKLFESGSTVLRDIILRNTGISPSDLQKNIWFV